MSPHTAMRRAQARHDGLEQPGGTPYHPDAVDEALDYVRQARRAGAAEDTYELLCEATRDLAVRQRAAWFLGLPPLATTTAIQLRGEIVGTDAAWGTACLRFIPVGAAPWAEWAVKAFRQAARLRGAQ